MGQSSSAHQADMLVRSGFQPYRPDERHSHPAGAYGPEAAAAYQAYSAMQFAPGQTRLPQMTFRNFGIIFFFLLSECFRRNVQPKCITICRIFGSTIDVPRLWCSSHSTTSGILWLSIAHVRRTVVIALAEPTRSVAPSNGRSVC